jgi:acetate---CoA ligase (ADP-forming)
MSFPPEGMTRTSPTATSSSSGDGGRGLERLTNALRSQNVAIFGASATPGKMGHEIVRQLIDDGFTGELTLVNPRAGQVCGRATTSDAGDAAGADVAVIATPRGSVEEILRQCGQVQIPLAIVCSGGYRESGDEEAERQLVATARDEGISLLGPNCVGIFVSDSQLNLTTMPLPAGDISCIVQSGGVSWQVAHRLRNLGAGFDALINLGNKSDIDFTVALQAVALRPQTSCILLYMESFDEGDRFLSMLSNVALQVPVVITFGGETAAGLYSARSHTGAILTPWSRLSGVFESHGAFVAPLLSEGVAAAVAGRRTQPAAQRRSGRRVFVLSDGGGLATLTADALSRAGFVLPQPSTALNDALFAIADIGRARPSNPLDFAGMADRNPHLYPQALKAALDSGEYDGAVLVGALGSYRQLYGDAVGELEEAAAHAIAELGRLTPLPIVAQSSVASDASMPVKILRDGGIACFEWPEEAAAGLSVRLRPRHDSVGAVESSHGLREAAESTWDATLARDIDRVLTIFQNGGIPHALGDIVSREHASTFPGERWVLRLDGFPHKTQLGAIKVVDDREKLAAFDELTALAAQVGVEPLIRLAPYVEHRHEVLVTFWRREAEGRGWAVGSGGLIAEQAADLQTGGFPVTLEGVFGVLSETRIYRTLLEAGPEAVDALVALVVRLAQLFEGPLADLDELECNPVAVGEFGTTILDVLPSR